MGRVCVLMVCAVILVALVCGCAPKEKTVVLPGVGKMKIKEGAGKTEATTTVETGEGTVTTTVGEDREVTEAEFGAPVYPGAKLQASGEFQGNNAAEGTYKQMMIETGDDFEKVYAFYKAKLGKTEGSFVHQDQKGGKVAMFNVKQGKESRAINIAYNPKEKKTMIMVHTMAKP